MPVIAIADLGSNSFHANIFRLDQQDNLSLIESFKKTTQLAEQIDLTGEIPGHQIREIIDFLITTQELSAQYQAEIRVIATQVFRTAKNAQELLQKVEDETGLIIEIVDGIEEARLFFLGTKAAAGHLNGRYLGIDIGGSSTELILVDNYRLSFATSLKIGALDGTINFLPSNTYTVDQIMQFSTFVTARLERVARDLGKTTFVRGLATSGTGKALARVEKFLSKGQIDEDTEGHNFSSERMTEILKHLVSTPRELISSQFGIGPKRAEIIVAGAIIFKAVSDVFGVKEWVVTRRGIRDGAAWDYYTKNFDFIVKRNSNIREDAVDAFAKKFGIDPKQAQSTKTLALTCFDEIVKLVPKAIFTSRQIDYRQILGAAAFLNRAGQYLSYPSYHKHSYYLIANSELMGYTQQERHLIALICRYSRKKPPKLKKAKKKPYLLRFFKELNVLSACVRFAKVFDHGGPEQISELRFSRSGGSLQIKCRLAPSARLLAISQKSEQELDHLESSLGLSITYDIQSSSEP